MKNIFERGSENTFGAGDLTQPERAHAEFPNPLDRSVEWVRNFVNEHVKGSRLPNRFYESQVDLYGGKLKAEGGQVIFDMTAASDRNDIKGDKKVRPFDDHVVRDPLKMFLKHPKELLKRLPGVAEPKRYRAQTPEETYTHVIKELGLEDMYGPHEHGLVLKHPEILTEGTDLIDIWRQDIINNADLGKTDRFQALDSAARYIKAVHGNSKRGAGDLTLQNIIFRKRDSGGVVSEPTLLMPNMRYNPKLEIPLAEQYATDLIDFVWSAATEEWRRTGGDEASIAKTIDAVFAAYDDEKIINLVGSYMKRGRLNMPAEGVSVSRPISKTADILRSVTSLHNSQRMKTDAEASAGIRRLIIERSVAYWNNSQKSETES